MDCLRQQMEGTVCGTGFQNVLALCLRHDGNTIFCERIHNVIAYIIFVIDHTVAALSAVISREGK